MRRTTRRTPEAPPSRAGRPRSRSPPTPEWEPGGAARYAHRLARTARTGATEAFFAGLAERGESPHLRKAVGSVRFDVVHGRRTRRWLVTFDRGQVTVAPASADAEAGCLLRAERAVFEGLAAGRLNAVTAVLRGDLVAEGDPRLLVRLQRLFPGSRRPRRRVTS